MATLRSQTGAPWLLLLSVLMTAGCAPPLPAIQTPVGISRTVFLASGSWPSSQRILLAWTIDSWPHGQVFGPILREATRGAGAVVAVAPDLDPEEVLLFASKWGADPDRIELLVADLDTFWVRDFGPQLTRRGAQTEVVDLDYSGPREGDDLFPKAFAAHFSLGVEPSTIYLEGGHLLRDGAGTCLTTDMALQENEGLGLSYEDFVAELRQLFGCQQTHILPALFGERTGHVDMVAAFAGPGRVLLGSYTPSQDPVNARRLNEGAETLRSAGLEVTRVPMPPHSPTGPFPTYLNLLVLDRSIVVPTFEDTPWAIQTEAITAIGHAFAGREVVTVPGEALAALEGGVHCVALELPIGELPLRRGPTAVASTPPRSFPSRSF